MNHLREADIVTLRDGEDATLGITEHADDCDRCRSDLDDARERSRSIESALRLLDEPVDLERARIEIRRRLDARVESGHAERFRPTRRWGRGHLRRAAALLLVTAGAASALPGGPLHRWLTSREAQEAPHEAEQATVRAAPEATPAGITAAVPPEGLRVTIDAPGGLERLRVVWGPAGTARLEAPEGSRFTYAAGRIEAAIAAGDAVRLVLPREGAPIEVEVGGRTVLSRDGNDVVVTAPILERSDEGLVLGSPGAVP